MSARHETNFKKRRNYEFKQHPLNIINIYQTRKDVNIMLAYIGSHIYNIKHTSVL